MRPPYLQKGRKKMADHKIVPGDVVQLKSGGPHMTAIKLDEECVFCQWFDDKSKVCGENFLAVTLDWIDPNRSFV
jgi:uncharacterized protein YodC (DUF2158 family)